MRVSDTTLTNYAKCPRKAFLARRCRMEGIGERKELLSGGAGHKALAEYTRVGDRKAAMRVFAAEYSEWAAANVPPTDGRSWENSRDNLEAWFDDYPEVPWKGHEGVEMRGFVPWVDGHEMEFVLDVIVPDQAAPYLVDHKFTGWLSDARVDEWRDSSQFSCYVWAMQALRPDLKLPFVIVNAVEWVNLPGRDGTNRKCKKHGTDYSECRRMHAKHRQIVVPRTQWQIDEWRVAAEGLTRRFVAMYNALSDDPTVAVVVPARGRFTGHCVWCDFRQWCATGCNPVVMEMMIRKRESER